MLDVLIEGGTVVTATGPQDLSIGIAHGQIVSLVANSSDLQATTRLDATNQIVVPGGIDPHVHTSWIVPTAASLGIRSAGATDVSRAAAYGGTTTIIDFAFVSPEQSLAAALEAKEAEYSGKSFVDYSFHGTFKAGEIPTTVLAEVHEAIEAGFPTFKVWMTNTTPSRPKQKTDFGHIWALLEQTGRHGGLLAVHAEDDDIVMYAYRRLQEEGRYGFENVHLAHNELSEKLSFQRIIGLAEYLGAPIYLMHVSAALGVRAVREARSRHQPVFGETLQHYLSFTADDYRRPNGAMYHTYPSLKSEEDRLALWEAVRDGTISTVATDEMCTTLETKVRGKTIDDVTGGHAGVEVRMGLMFSEIVSKRGWPLERFVDVTSANAARIFGLYPQKGAIAVNSDADLVLMQPTEPRPLRLADLHETDYTAWEGWEITAWPSVTLSRGNIIVENGALRGQPGDGRRPHRQISSHVLSSIA